MPLIQCSRWSCATRYEAAAGTSPSTIQRGTSRSDTSAARPSKGSVTRRWTCSSCDPGSGLRVSESRGILSLATRAKSSRISRRTSRRTRGFFACAAACLRRQAARFCFLPQVEKAPPSGTMVEQGKFAYSLRAGSTKMRNLHKGARAAPL